MLATDERFAVADTLVDRRATHFWDGGKLVGLHFGEGGFVAWDVFYFYGPDARWGDPPDATGAPVVQQGPRLADAAAPYLRT